MDLDLAAVTAPTAAEVSFQSEGSVEEPPAIDASWAPTMDNVIPASGTGTDTPAPLLVTRPSLPPERKE